MKSALLPWLLAARPKTLGAAVAPVLVGSALGWKAGGPFRPGLALAALGSCVCLQVATNLFNDAVDGLKGSDTRDRLGPVRVTASGMVSARNVLRAAVGALILAVALAVPLFLQRGWPILAIGIPSLYFCYGYTGGPWPLAYRGLGELFVILFFGLVAVTGSAFVQSGRWHSEAVVAGLQVGMLSTVLIAINNLRDAAEDSGTGKRTLAVRLGIGFARWEIRGLILGTMILCLHWVFVHPVSVVPLLMLLLAVLLGVIEADIRKPPSPALNATLAKAGLGLVVFAVLFAVGLVIEQRKGGRGAPPAVAAADRD